MHACVLVHQGLAGAGLTVYTHTHVKHAVAPAAAHTLATSAPMHAGSADAAADACHHCQPALLPSLHTTLLGDQLILQPDAAGGAGAHQRVHAGKEGPRACLPACTRAAWCTGVYACAYLHVLLCK